MRLTVLNYLNIIDIHFFARIALNLNICQHVNAIIFLPFSIAPQGKWVISIEETRLVEGPPVRPAASFSGEMERFEVLQNNKVLQSNSTLSITWLHILG